jgi:NADPH:quinone reductase-like Zn-dependent oxidoreductase
VADAVLAARLHDYSEPLVVEPVELPDPSPDEVRVELRFGGVNPIDARIAAGFVNPGGPLPRTLGFGGRLLRPEELRPAREEALQALADGSLRVRIDSVLALEDVNEAFERLKLRAVEGKLLLDLG